MFFNGSSKMQSAVPSGGGVPAPQGPARSSFSAAPSPGFAPGASGQYPYPNTGRPSISSMYLPSQQQTVHYGAVLSTQPSATHPNYYDYAAATPPPLTYAANAAKEEAAPPAYDYAPVPGSTNTKAPSPHTFPGTTANPSEVAVVNPPLTRNISVKKTPVPPIPSQFPELEAMSELQLEHLLKDEVSLRAHAASMEVVTSMVTVHDDLRDSNVREANDLLLQVQESVPPSTTTHSDCAQKQELMTLRETVITAQRELSESIKQVSRSVCHRLF